MTCRQSKNSFINSCHYDVIASRCHLFLHCLVLLFTYINISYIAHKIAQKQVEKMMKVLKQSYRTYSDMRKNAIGSLFGCRSCDFYDEVCFRKLDHSQKITLKSKISKMFWMIYYLLHMILSTYTKEIW